MKYYEKVKLKNNKDCLIFNATKENGKEVLDLFILTHGQTNNLRTYPEECKMTPSSEGEFLQNQTDSERNIELVSQVDGKIVGSAGIEEVSSTIKTKHRADFGISIDKAYWGLGIGKALSQACIKCAKDAGYKQIELEVVSENTPAIALYKSLGFVEFGRNPCGFLSKEGEFQELILMRKVLN